MLASGYWMVKEFYFYPVSRIQHPVSLRFKKWVTEAINSTV
jgi:hypothetical protein